MRPRPNLLRNPRVSLPLALLSPIVLLIGLPLALPTVFGTPAFAACDVAGLKLEEAIAQKSELREPANAQALRDLRTLRDAAVVLDALKYDTDCERLVAIVRTLGASPARTIERSGDTDEEKAEAIEETRVPKTPPAKDAK